MTDRSRISGDSGPNPHVGRSGPSDGAKLARTLAALTGAVFLLVGVLGFIPGITTNYDDLSFAGHHSEAKLLGIFQVSILHNLVHVAFGLAGLALSRKARTAVAFLIGGGVVYLVLWIYGLVIDHDSSANFVPLNSADNWLHLVLGVGMIAMGLLGQRELRGGVGSQTPM